VRAVETGAPPALTPLPLLCACSHVDFATFRQFFMLLPSESMAVDYWLRAGEGWAGQRKPGRETLQTLPECLD
jgi:hypothetical protein